MAAEESQGLNEKQLQIRTAQFSLLVHVLTSIVDILIENEEASTIVSLNEAIDHSPSPENLEESHEDPIHPSIEPSWIENRQKTFEVATYNVPDIKRRRSSAKNEEKIVEEDLKIVEASPEDDIFGAGDFVLPYNLTVIEPENSEADSAVIVLHGLGGSTETIRPIVELIQSVWPGSTRFILPQAPQQYVTFFNKTMSSWFDILSDEIDGPQDYDSIVAASSNIAMISKHEQSLHDIPSSRIAVVGMSQGGALALTTYLRGEWGGAVSLSGWLPISSTYPEEMSNTGQNSPVLIMHGSEDETVPVLAAQITALKLQSLGKETTYVEIPGAGHGLDSALDQILASVWSLLDVILST